MTAQIDANKLLDDTLTIVCRGTEPHRRFIYSYAIVDELKKLDYDIDVRLVMMVLDRLKADGYISDDMEKHGKGVSENSLAISSDGTPPVINTVEYQKVGTEAIWIALFNGIVFNQNGGYTEKRNQEQADALRILRTNQLLLRGTWAAAIVAAILLLFEMYKFCYENSLIFVCP